MDPSPYTEEQLVEQPAIQLFVELGGEALSVWDEVLGANGAMQLRETRSEVVLIVRLRTALTTLNPSLPPEAIAVAVDELSRDRSAMLLSSANRELWQLMRDGAKVSEERDRPRFPSTRGCNNVSLVDRANRWMAPSTSGQAVPPTVNPSMRSVG